MPLPAERQQAKKQAGLDIGSRGGDAYEQNYNGILGDFNSLSF